MRASHRSPMRQQGRPAIRKCAVGGASSAMAAPPVVRNSKASGGNEVRADAVERGPRRGEATAGFRPREPAHGCARKKVANHI